jgi:prevent-host-death family protein
MKINVLEAKTRLSQLIAAAEAGEEVLLARNGQPVAKIVKYSPPKIQPPGAWSGLVEYSPDWDSPSSNLEVAKAFLDSP